MQDGAINVTTTPETGKVSRPNFTELCESLLDDYTVIYTHNEERHT